MEKEIRENISRKERESRIINMKENGDEEVCAVKGGENRGD